MQSFLLQLLVIVLAVNLTMAARLPWTPSGNQLIRRRRDSYFAECEMNCGSRIYMCDLRCKYWPSLKRGAELQKCQIKCGNDFLDCYRSCIDDKSYR